VSDLPKSLSIVSYAVNGRGLGHLARLVAINRWLRRYATFAGVRTQHWFLTTSEADTLLHREGFAGFKLPSKSAVEEAGITKLDYIALAKQWIWHSAALLRPDVLIVDTFPNGSFQELLGVLDLCRTKVLVMRPTKAEFSARASFQAVARLYDTVIVPAHADEHPRLAQDLGLDPQLVRFVGPVIRGERFEALDRATARARIGVPADARCWLVTGGGGGDDDVGRLCARTTELLLADREAFVVVAAGPLHRGPRIGGARVRWWTSPDLVEHLPAFDAAICAGGFNAVHETMFAGIPTIIVPQAKVADDQGARARAFADRGAAIVASLAGDELPRAIARLSDDDERRRMSDAARAVVPRNHARNAAEQILALHLPATVVAAAREAVDDDLLADLRRLDVSLADTVAIANAIHPDAAGPDEIELDRAHELVELAARHDLPVATLVRIVQQLARRFKPPVTPSRDELFAALAQLVESPRVRHQWSALAMLLGALVGERELTVTAFVSALDRLLDDALGRGLDVFATARMVLEHAGRLAEVRGNTPLFAAIRDSWSTPVPVEVAE